MVQFWQAGTGTELWRESPSLSGWPARVPERPLPSLPPEKRVRYIRYRIRAPACVISVIAALGRHCRLRTSAAPWLVCKPGGKRIREVSQ